MANEPVITASTSERGEEHLISWADAEKVRAASETGSPAWTTASHGAGHRHLVGRSLYSCNPRSERKYRNLTTNPVCQALTGCSRLNEGLDVAVHGRAGEMPEMADRLRFGRQMAEKYSEPWRFEGTEEDMWVYRIVPTHVRAFHRFNPISSARWDFDPTR